MTEEETLKILAVLKVAYPHSFQKMSKSDGWALVRLWQTQFASFPYEIVNAAIHSLIATRTVGYSPTIGEVKEQIQNHKASKGLSDQEAWMLVSKACANGFYHSREEFEKLPPDVQKAVGGPEQLKAWSLMDEETVGSVVASNFMRTYRTTQERQKQMEMVPTEVREVLSGVAKNLSIEGGGQKQIAAPKERIVPIEPEQIIRAKEEREKIVLPPPDHPPAPKYTPPPSDVFEKKREEAMRKLAERKETEDVVSSKPPEAEPPLPEIAL